MYGKTIDISFTRNKISLTKENNMVILNDKTWLNYNTSINHGNKPSLIPSANVKFVLLEFSNEWFHSEKKLWGDFLIHLEKPY